MILEYGCQVTEECYRPGVGFTLSGIERALGEPVEVVSCRDCARVYGLELRIFELKCSTWLEYGVAFGFCGPAVCATHDGIPTAAEEDEAFEEGDDVCVHVVRLYVNAEHKDAVERSHHPSVWRDEP